MRHGKLAIPLTTALIIVSAPLHVDFGDAGPRLFLHEAAAKAGNNGNGNRGGNGNSENSGHNGNANSGNGRAVGKSRGNSAMPADSVVDKQVTKDSVRIRYRNGYREQVVKGRFIMQDTKGRTIINRRATPVDRMRLWLKQAVP